MSGILRILRYLVLFGSIALMAGCASSRQNPYHKKRTEPIKKVNPQQLGKNRYYYSPNYQKKLLKGYKKKRKY